MNTTDTLDIYAPGNEAAWISAVMSPLMGKGLRWYTSDFYPRSFEDGEKSVTFRKALFDPATVVEIRPTDPAIPKWIRIEAEHREPIGAYCLALCAYRRAVEEVSDGD